MTMPFRHSQKSKNFSKAYLMCDQRHKPTSTKIDYFNKENAKKNFVV